MINLSDPVNLNHRLNQGKAGWWMYMPEIGGGNQLLNLMGNNHGVMNFTGGSGGWSSLSPPGGTGSLLFDTDPQYISIPGSWVCTEITFSCWVNLNTPNIYRSFMCSRGTSGDSLMIVQPGGINKVGATYNGDAYDWELGPTIPLNKWVFIAMTCTPTGLTTFCCDDGVVNYASLSRSIGATTTIDNLELGRDYYYGTGLFGSYNDWGFWTRALSVSEIAEYYELSRRGYKDILNDYDTLSRTSFLFAGALPTVSVINYSVCGFGGGIDVPNYYAF